MSRFTLGLSTHPRARLLSCSERDAGRCRREPRARRGADRDRDGAPHAGVRRAVRDRCPSRKDCVGVPRRTGEQRIPRDGGDTVHRDDPRVRRRVLRFEHPEQKDLWIEITTVGARPSHAQADSVAVAYDEAALDTDVVEIAAREGGEEVRLLRTSPAPTTTRYTLRTGPAIAQIRARARGAD